MSIPVSIIDCSLLYLLFCLCFTGCYHRGVCIHWLVVHRICHSVLHLAAIHIPVSIQCHWLLLRYVASACNYIHVFCYTVFQWLSLHVFCWNVCTSVVIRFLASVVKCSVSVLEWLLTRVYLHSVTLEYCIFSHSVLYHSITLCSVALITYLPAIKDWFSLSVHNSMCFHIRILWLAGCMAAMSSITYPGISAFVSSHASPDQQGRSFLFCRSLSSFPPLT